MAAITVLVLDGSRSAGRWVVRELEALQADRQRRRTLLTAAAALLAGTSAATVASQASLVNGLGTPIGWIGLPLVFGAAHTTVFLVSERTWPRPQGVVRSASLRARSVRTIAPRGMSLLLAAGAVGVLGVSTVVWATLDGATAGLRRPYGDGYSEYEAVPGVRACLPMIVATLVVLVAVHTGLRLIARRPAQPGDSEDEGLLRRRRSAHGLLRGACAALLAEVFQLLQFFSSDVSAVHSPSAAVQGLHVLGVMNQVLLPVCAIAGCAVLCLPAAIRRPRGSDGAGPTAA